MYIDVEVLKMDAFVLQVGKKPYHSARWTQPNIVVL